MYQLQPVFGKQYTNYIHYLDNNTSIDNNYPIRDIFYTTTGQLQQLIEEQYTT